MGDVLGDGEEDDGGEEHEECSGADARPTGGGDLRECTCAGADATDAMAYSNSGCRGDGEGHHERGAGALQRDFMPGEWQRAKGGDERGDEREDGDFDRDLRACRSAEEEEFAEVLELDAA